MCAVAVFDSASLPMIEEMYAKFRADPMSVDAEWKAYFLGWEASGSGQGGGSVDSAAQLWRERGHLAAGINPIWGAPEVPAELKADEAVWRPIYGGSIGIECAVVREPDERAWVQSWWEGDEGKKAPGRDVQLRLYDGLARANGLEKFLHTKFVGAKRFSVEGVDAIVPLMSEMAAMAAADGVSDVVVGMAHRGRLNVLCNIFHKPVAELFAAFADKMTVEGGPSVGDVKYHMGKVYKAHTVGGDVTLQLLFNPSHLEAVNGSVLGVARGKRDTGAGVLAVMVHGDSAVAGQGSVAESNNLMGLPAYDVGGVLHFVLNNQVGFTANPDDAYAGVYCTDIFKSMGVPIVHVNADDIEACWRVLRFAMAYRQKFGKDVVMELMGYRRWGHNEGDDPTFTQPLLYEKVRAHEVPVAIYGAKLKAAGVDEAELAALDKAYADELNEAFAEAQKGITTKTKAPKVAGGKVETAVDAVAVKRVVEAWGKVPAGFVFNDKVGKAIDERVAMLRGEKPLNWGAAETTAYGCLVQEGIFVRMSGQDVQRGTFVHRHAVLVGAKDGQKWSPLDGLKGKEGGCVLYNSALSENAVMGFEYGYALARPEKSLVIWEGQFGDFANGAQVVIDQFIASAEAKWGQLNHLVLLLPHGYEGQASEHSSARLERFLQLCAEENIRVCYPTTPGQIFHLLRRQALSPVKKPLVVMTPKSLLRHPLAVSPLSDLLHGAWQPVIADAGADKAPRKVVLCSGRVYYDLLARREADKRTDVALLRVEELYPWPAEAIAEALKTFKVRDVYWVQEEPRNMGAWTHVRESWDEELGYLHYVGRSASAAPAAGTTAMHNREQGALIDSVFADEPAKPRDKSGLVARRAS